MTEPQPTWGSTQEDFTVFAGNDPSMRFVLYDIMSNGNRVKSDLSDAIIECTVQDTVFSSERDEIIVVSKIGGVCQVNFKAEAFNVPRSNYRLDVIRDGRRLTYYHGVITKEGG